jgi:hypothetical protein
LWLGCCVIWSTVRVHGAFGPRCGSTVLLGHGTGSTVILSLLVPKVHVHRVLHVKHFWIVHDRALYQPTNLYCLPVVYTFSLKGTAWDMCQVSVLQGPSASSGEGGRMKTVAEAAAPQSPRITVSICLCGSLSHSDSSHEKLLDISECCHPACTV